MEIIIIGRKLKAILCGHGKIGRVRKAAIMWQTPSDAERCPKVFDLEVFLMSGIITFQETHPSIESYWRSIILFGRNVASYKFALAASLLEIVPTGKTIVTLDDLSEPFSRHLCEHLLNAPKQSTSQTSQFLDSCRSYNRNEISKEELLGVTVQKGFNNVIDAFHIVNEGAIPIRFFEKDYSKGDKRIILTDEIFKLQSMQFYDNLSNEAHARWNLVETAWELGVSRSLITVNYDGQSETLFVNEALRRKTVTSARDALNGYQKGKCFYCFRDIAVNENTENGCDVDHFYPHVLKAVSSKLNIDGIWNLVLACPQCNRGIEGKFARVPATKYLSRLQKRNEFLISSHHPLRETLVAQTGASEQDRASYIREIDKLAINALIHRWETKPEGKEVF